jgi:hypothetical protein
MNIHPIVVQIVSELMSQHLSNKHGLLIRLAFPDCPIGESTSEFHAQCCWDSDTRHLIEPSPLPNRESAALAIGIDSRFSTVMESRCLS